MKQELLKGRLTSKKIITWFNEILPEMGMSHLRVFAVERTYYTADQYESGACRLHIRFKNTELDKSSVLSEGSFMSFLTIKQLQDHIKDGWEVYLKTDRLAYIANTELDIRKPKN